MDDKRIGQVPNALFLLDSNFLVARTAIVVIDFLASNHALKRGLKSLLVFDCARERVEGLIRAHDISTVLANGEAGHLTFEDALADILLGSVLE